MHIGLVDLKWRGHHTPYIVYLSRYFTEQAHEVTFITDEEHPHLDELPASKHLHIQTASFPKLDRDPGSNLIASVREQWIRVRQLWRIFQLSNQAEVEVLHFLYFDRTQVPMCVASKLFRETIPPIVTTSHRDAFTETKTKSIPKRLTQLATIHSLNSCLANGSIRYLTVHTESIRQRIIDSVEAATTENTMVIPAPTPDLSVDVMQDQAREYLELPTGIPIFLFFGGLRYEKGPDLLAEAMQHIDHPAAVLFAGSEADFTQRDINRWKRHIDEPVEVIDHITFIPEGEVDYYFVAANALILPYRRRKGISGPLRRACMAGTPIVGNAKSDIGYIIKQHGLGVTFKSESPVRLAEAIKSLLDSSERPRQKRLEQYGKSVLWTETGSSLELLYREATSPNG